VRDDGPGGVEYPFPTPPAPGAALEIAPGILWLRLPLPMRPDHLNVYALDDGAGWTVIDTGLSTAPIRAIWQDILDGPLGGRPVRRVILTHFHPDHTGNAGWFRALGAEILATRTTWLYARMLTLDAQERPTPEMVAFWRRGGMDPALLAAREASRPFNFADVVDPIPLGFRALSQGDEIDAGGRRWRVETGHGHAPDQATLWGIGHDLVLSADQILPGITPNLGVYATEPDADPVGDWLVTCARLKALARPEHLALPGHRRPFTGLALRLQELIDHQHDALHRLSGFLATARRAAECFDLLYGRPIGDGEYGLALGEALGHLNYLHRRGLAERVVGPGDAWLWRSTGARPAQA
jgi:glyoxylase-like metal-dependent hydrolase (beta-lactamase superfamily II)